MAEDVPEARDLRPAWRWGVWIGSMLLALGILAAVRGFMLLDLDHGEAAEHMRAPTPEMVRAQGRTGVLLILQGVLAVLIGSAMLALSLFRLHASRVRGEERGPWSSPAA